MKLKVGREEYNLDESDRIMFNGAVFILITRTAGYGFNKYSPTVSKVRMNKLIKNGDMILCKEKYIARYQELDMYKIKEDN